MYFSQYHIGYAHIIQIIRNKDLVLNLLRHRERAMNGSRTHTGWEDTYGRSTSQTNINH